MKNKYQAFTICEATIPGESFPTVKECIEYIRISMFECDTEEMIVWNRFKEKVIRRFHWGDFRKGGKMFKSPDCPKCGSSKVVPIMYGLPMQKLIDRWERGEVELGGCIIDPNNPDFFCRDCENKFK